jgi:CDP-2,3-bis-(O-geranylgeranyl)-sn-glycerol synthase
MSITAVLYLFVPAFVANAVPVLIKNIPALAEWNTPIHAECFGKNKTYRGFLFGVLFAVLVSVLQYALRHVAVFSSVTMFHDTVGQSALVGLLLGFGALAGDVVESYAKRRMKLAPGKSLPVWDGVDYILGAMLCIMPVYIVSGSEMFILLIIAPLLSLLSNIFSYMVGWKEVWY